MGENFNSSMLLLARQYRGRSQADVASDAGINQGHYSKIENGLLPEGPSEDTVERIACALNLPLTFFYQSDRITGLPLSVHPMHRKKASVGERALQRMHAELNVRLLHLRRLLSSVELDQELPLPLIDVDEGGGPEAIAATVRQAWMLPRGPIQNLTDCIERAGCLVIWCDFGVNVDGVKLKMPDLPPCIFLNKNVPADRMRFSLAHELGHLVMHHIPSDDMENEANAFSSSLLMPAADIRKDFVDRITLDRLIRLKSVWRVSIQALLYRASSLGSITRNQAAYLWRQISQLGWRTREPIETDFERETPTIFPRIVGLHVDDFDYTIDELAAVLSASKSDMANLYNVAEGAARGVHLRVIK